MTSQYLDFEKLKVDIRIDDCSRTIQGIRYIEWFARASISEFGGHTEEARAICLNKERAAHEAREKLKVWYHQQVAQAKLKELVDRCKEAFDNPDRAAQQLLELSQDWDAWFLKTEERMLDRDAYDEGVGILNRNIRLLSLLKE